MNIISQSKIIKNNNDASICCSKFRKVQLQVQTWNKMVYTNIYSKVSHFLSEYMYQRITAYVLDIRDNWQIAVNYDQPLLFIYALVFNDKSSGRFLFKNAWIKYHLRSKIRNWNRYSEASPPSIAVFLSISEFFTQERHCTLLQH